MDLSCIISGCRDWVAVLDIFMILNQLLQVLAPVLCIKHQQSLLFMDYQSTAHCINKCKGYSAEQSLQAIITVVSSVAARPLSLIIASMHIPYSQHLTPVSKH
jgi:hypothetical protein